MSRIETLLTEAVRKTFLDDSAADNIRNCSTSGKTKVLYLRQLNSTPNKVAAGHFHDHFRKNRIRKGPEPDDLLPDEGLGFLMKEETFKRYHKSLFSMDTLKFYQTYDLWISYHKKRMLGTKPNQREVLAASTFLTSKLPTRLDGEAWLFRNPAKRQDPFEGVADEYLPLRLGLHILPGERRLTFGFFARNVDNVKRPQFLDASWSYLSLWDWKGKTKPLPATPPSLDGFEEVVAKPPHLRDLCRPIEVIEI